MTFLAIVNEFLNASCLETIVLAVAYEQIKYHHYCAQEKNDVPFQDTLLFIRLYIQVDNFVCIVTESCIQQKLLQLLFSTLIKTWKEKEQGSL